MSAETLHLDFSLIPSLEHTAGVAISAGSGPGSATVIGVPVAVGGGVPADVGFDRARLEASGFGAKVGATLVVPTTTGATVVAVGVGDAAQLDAASLRNAAAAFARDVGSHAELAFSLAGTETVAPGTAAQAVVEGVLLARYAFDPLRRDPKGTPVAALTLVTGPDGREAVGAGAERGRVFATVTQLARDLANTPHNHLNASTFADVATSLGQDRGLGVEVFDKEALLEMGCGGLLGVNAGSTEPPRMIKLTYRPSGAEPAARLSLVGKGIMYDSGGLALKPGDEVHAQMKNDMSGAAAILAAMAVLDELGCANAVDGYLMCTDNMPSGTALALGDVITMRDGTTVEVINTDAEGRLVMADALALATEEPVDAIVDIATLTGACMRALGTQVAGVMGNDQAVVEQVRAAAAATDEPVWQLPLERRYRKELDSTIADLKNLGGANAGAITAALFLAEFVGNVPWAHIDIAGTAQSPGETGWLTSGCTGFGARLLAQLAIDFSAPGAREVDVAEPEVATTPEAGGAPPAERGFVQKMLDGIETAGNKVPHPAIIFLGLCVLVIALSAVLAAFDVSVTYDVVESPPVAAEEEYVGGSVVPELIAPPEDYAAEDMEVVQETTSIKSLLSTDGVRFIFSSFVNNFAGFSVVAVIFVAMIGVGVAEEAGLMGALIRKLVKVAPGRLLTFIIVFVGGLSSVATDAGYLILIPLGAAAFLSVGRHPLAGLAAAYAGVSAGFAVNVLITPLDGLLTEVTNEAIHLADPTMSIDLTANLWFAIASTVFVAIVITVVAQKITEPTLGTYEGVVDVHTEDEVPAGEGKGLRYASYGVLVAVIGVVLLTVLPDAPLRNPETGDIFNNSPLMDSLIFIITMLFLVAGICFGIGAKTITSSVDVINAITKTFASLAGLVFLLLLISQFIAYFNFSNMPTIAAVKMADALESADIGALWLLIGFIFVIVILDLIIPGSLPKWAIFAPIFVPLFLRLDVAPQTVLAAYRLGDSPANVITPLMVYLPFIVIVAQRYKKDVGIGTIISLMIPYTVIVLVAWTLFFVAWYLIGIPMGPGYPALL